MPIYDYHCDHCGHSFSAVRRFADDAISVCPGCGKLPRKLMSNPALVFKGSGWYKTDSRGPEKKDSGGPGTEHGKDSKDASKPSTAAAAGGSGDGPAPSGGGPDGSNSASPSGSAAPEPAKKPEKAAPASS